MKQRTKTMCGWLMMLGMTFATTAESGTLLIGENFDNFASPSPIQWYTVNKVKWGAFRTPTVEDPWLTVSDTIYHGSSGKALILREKKSTESGSPELFASHTSSSITSNQFEASLWLQRLDATSGAYLSITGASGAGNYYVNRNVLSVSIKTSGKLFYNTVDGWLDSGYSVPASTWPRIRWVVNRQAGTFDLYVRTDSESESQIVTGATAAGLTQDLVFNYFYLRPDTYQSDVGEQRMAYDDLSMVEASEPSVLSKGCVVLNQKFDGFDSPNPPSQYFTIGTEKWWSFVIPNTTNPYTLVSDTIYHGALGKSVILREKNTSDASETGNPEILGCPIDAANTYIKAKTFEASLWLERLDLDSGGVISISGSGPLGSGYYAYRNHVSIDIKPSGQIYYMSNLASVDSGYTLSKGEWAKFRFLIDRTACKYSVFMTTGNNTNEFQVVKDAISPGIDQVNFNYVYIRPDWYPVSDGIPRIAYDDIFMFDLSIPGDANVDGAVNVSDLSLLAANYGTVSGATWAMGDFTGDGAVNVSDLSLLAANYGTRSSSTLNWADAYAHAFGTTGDANDTSDDVSDDSEDTTSSICSGLGLSLIAGLVMIGLMLVRLEE
jgi:hypothetical protein